MLTMYVGNLPPDTRENDVETLFSQYGKVRGVKMSRDVFSGKCRGFAFVDMEGHEARAAIAGLDGSDFNGRPLRVNQERAKDSKGRGRRR
ncbi:MAG: RNA-binding protein [Chromatiales bacterium]|nr:RNA-binding protein [Chromatiales bacterium]